MQCNIAILLSHVQQYITDGHTQALAVFIFRFLLVYLLY